MYLMIITFALFVRERTQMSDFGHLPLCYRRLGANATEGCPWDNEKPEWPF